MFRTADNGTSILFCVKVMMVTVNETLIGIITWCHMKNIITLESAILNMIGRSSDIAKESTTEHASGTRISPVTCVEVKRSKTTIASRATVYMSTSVADVRHTVSSVDDGIL